MGFLIKTFMKNKIWTDNKVHDFFFNKSEIVWNYRIIKHNKDCYTIHEVFYKNGKPVSWTDKPISPVAQSPEDLKIDLTLIRQALKRPVLEIKKNKLKHL